MIKGRVTGVNKEVNTTELKQAARRIDKTNLVSEDIRETKNDNVVSGTGPDTQMQISAVQQLSPAQINNLAYTYIDGFNKANTRLYEYDVRAGIKDHTDYNKLMRQKDLIAYKEDLHIKRELVTYSLAFSEGFFYKVVNGPNSNHISKRPICDARNLSLVKFYADGTDEHAYLITWGESLSSPENWINIPADNFAPKYVAKRLTQEGVSFFGDRKYREGLLGQLLAALVKRASYTKLPRCTGWVKTDGEWAYIGHDSLTLQKVVEASEK